MWLKSVLVHCCPASWKWTPEPTLNKKCQDCLEVLHPVKKQATRHIWNNRFSCESISVLSGPTWANITQVKTLWNVVQESSDNNTQEKSLSNSVLILLGEHCTSENFVQCCPWDSKQYCTRKNPVQCCLNTFWTTFHNRVSMQCCPWESKQHCTSNWKNLDFKINLVLNRDKYL